MPSLSLSLLGPFQAVLDGRPVTGLESNKVRALLAYLAVEGDRPHSRDEIIGLLWPDQPDTAARANLRQALANLRNAIGDRTSEAPFLLATFDSVQLQSSENCSIDGVTFTGLIAACRTHAHRRLETCRSCAQRLQQAAELYRGDFLAQFVQSGSDAFEEWALIQRERLHREVLDALFALAEYSDRRSEYDQVRHYAARQLELDPWREEAHRQVMRALALSGQRSAALAQYEICRRVLADELGAEPSQETTMLCEKIKSGDLAHAERRHNLPAALTSLIGRGRELTEIDRLLETPTCRLLTLTGPGGMGKTRLALQAGTDHVGAFTHGVFFVSLAPLTSAALIVPAIADALQFTFFGRQDPKVQLFNYLREKEMLLILDNFEQIRDGAPLLGEMLRSAPTVTLLVTSRERLNLQGEWGFDLHGLQFPFNDRVASIEHYSAVELFVQSAQRVRTGFALSAKELPAIAQICRLVEGLPLALELSPATWVRVLSCGDIAHEIERSLSILTTTWPDVPEQHRSLWAVFEHSWQLLSDDEKSTFRKLVIFRGGFDWAAAEYVAGASLSLLAALVDKSLLRRGPEGRFTLHELVRQYADEKLEESHERGQIQSRHLQFYLDLAEAAEQELRGPEQLVWLQHLDAEFDNLRAAMDWAEESGQAQVGLRLAGALYSYWWNRGYWSEGRERLMNLLARPEAADGTPARAAALSVAGDFSRWLSGPEAAQALLIESKAVSLKLGATGKPHLAWSLVILGDSMTLRDKAFAQRALDESVALLREIAEPWHLAMALNSRGNLAVSQGDYALARASYSESLALFQKMGDRWDSGLPISGLGQVLYYLGEYSAARTRFQEALEIARVIGDKAITATQLDNVGTVAQLQGDVQKATELFEESLEIFREIGSKESIAWLLGDLGIAAGQLGESTRAAALLNEALPLSHEVGNVYLIAMCLLGLASIQRQSVRAAQLLAAAQTAFETSDEIVEPYHRAVQECVETATCAALGKVSYATAWAEGHAMTLQEAINYALAAVDSVR